MVMASCMLPLQGGVALTPGQGTKILMENPMDGGTWSAAVHGVAEGQTRLRDFTFTFTRCGVQDL